MAGLTPGEAVLAWETAALVVVTAVLAWATIVQAQATKRLADITKQQVALDRPALHFEWCFFSWSKLLEGPPRQIDFTVDATVENLGRREATVKSLSILVPDDRGLGEVCVQLKLKEAAVVRPNERVTLVGQGRVSEELYQRFVGRGLRVESVCVGHPKIQGGLLWPVSDLAKAQFAPFDVSEFKRPEYGQ